MNKHKNRKWVFIMAATLVVVGAAAAQGAVGTKAKAVSTDVVQRGELISSVDVSGTVESGNETYVYSKEALIAKKVAVSEGSRVKAGDVLAILDTEELDNNIEKIKLAIDSTLKGIEVEKTSIANAVENASNNLKSAELALEKQQMVYETAKSDYESGQLGAEGAGGAEAKKVKMAYDSAKEYYENENSPEAINAKTAVESSEKTLADSKTHLDAIKLLFDAGSVSKNEFDAAQTAYDNALLSHGNAVEVYAALKSGLKQKFDLAALDWQNVKQNNEDAYKRAGIDLQTARANLENAKTALAQASSKDTGLNEISMESQEVDLANLNAKKANAVITAPCDGTVTYVNLKEGQAPSGAVFIIEDMDNLYVKAYIKEFSLSSVKIGQPAAIKTDAAGGGAYAGTVSYIAPTSRKDAASSNNVEFEAKIGVAGPDAELRVGMNARVNIILAKKDDALYVPYDYVAKNSKGESVVYALENGEVKEVPVETGLESDVFLEITGGAQEGMKVITDPASVSPGEKATEPE